MSAPAGKSVVARNTLYAALGYFVSFAVPILVTPYIIHRITQEGFGILTALGALGAWLTRIDLGIGAALPREVAERRARGDEEGLAALAARWLLFDALAGAAVIALAALAGRPLLALAVPHAEAGAAYPALVAFAAQAALVVLMRHQIASLHGLQRMDLTNGLTIVVTPLSVGVLVLFLERGWGILGVVLNGVVSAALQVLLLFALLRRAGYPFGRVLRGASLGRLMGFGWKLEAAQVIAQVTRSDRLLLSATGLPPALLGFYQIGAGVADRLASAIQTLSSAVFPAASDLAARGERERILTLLMRGTKYHALAAAGLLGFATLFGPEIVVLWLGRPIPEAVAVLRLMAAGSALYSIVSCAQAVAVGLGRPGLPLAGALAGLAGTAVLYITLGRRYDYGGLAGSVSAGLGLAQAVFMIGFHRMMEFRWREWMGNALLKPLAAFAPVLAVYGAWRLAAPHLGDVSGRAGALALLGPAFLLSAALAWALARAFKVIDPVDVDVLRSLARRAPA